MIFSNLKEYRSPWFVGYWPETLHQTDNFEVGVMSFPEGYEADPHYHKASDEINVILDGSLKIYDPQQEDFITLSKGDIFVYEPNEIANVTYLEDSRILCVRTKSVPGDKYAAPKSCDC